MKNRIIIIISQILSLLFIVIGLAFVFAIPLTGGFLSTSFTIDQTAGVTFGSIFSGIVGTLFAVAGAFLVYASFVTQNEQNNIQQIESVFYKLLDFHYENINQIKLENYNYNKQGINTEGRSAFISMKLQLIDVLTIVEECFAKLQIERNDDLIIDISYILFYYGLDESWNDFIASKIPSVQKGGLLALLYFHKQEFNDHKRKDIFKTNQTYLSAYMRNMYNAIKIIDENKTLSKKRKEKYIKVLRAQLSNPELYILYFNIRSRFGKKWKENDYIRKYELFTNMPSGYCQKYDHKEYFPFIKYEDDELNS